jgi:type VI secretion system secreted protein Hcp
MRMITSPHQLLAVAAATLMLATPARADTDLILKDSILPGGSTPLTSLSWSITNSGTTHIAGGAGAGKASVQDISWSQPMNASTPALMRALVTGTRSTAQFDFVNRGRIGGIPNSKPYLSITTGKTQITNLAFDDNGVSASAGFSDITLAYTPVDQSGRLLPAVSTTFNVAENTVTGSLTRNGTQPLRGTAPAAVSGSTSVYLRLGSGGNVIAGDSRAAGYENWIELDSAQLSLSSTFSVAGGVGKPNVSDLSWTQQLDGTLPAVLANLASGRHLTEATLEYVSYGALGPVTFMQLSMKEVMFSALSLSSDGSTSQVSESINFGSMSQTAWTINANGTRGTASSFGYDLVKNQVIAGTLAANVSGFGAGNLAPTRAGAAVVSGELTPVLAAVPEPETYALFLAGLGLVGAIARRRQAKSVTA